jgi:hypothetical protein
MAGKIKGASMREILRWHERNGGREQLRAIGERLAPALRTHLDLDAEALGILPNTWYPAPLSHALLEGVFSGLTPEKRRAKMREAAHAALRVMGRGMYRLVLEKLATPRVLAANIQRLWNLLYDDGDREFVLTTPNSVESTTRDWSGHGIVLCELMTENTAAVLETMGMTHVTVDRVACVGHGAPACVTRFRWDAQR